MHAKKLYTYLQSGKSDPDHIEITGLPCSGKTTFIQNNFAGQYILVGMLPVSYGPVRRIIGSMFLSFYALITSSINLTQIKWLIKKAVIYDETCFARLNAFRNCIMKFGYRYFKLKDGVAIIDEGISHIPFILGLSNMDIEYFIKLFYNHLENKRIIFIQAPSIETLNKRLIARGHKRIRAVKDVEGFVGINIRIAGYYKKALSDSGLDVLFI